MTKVITALLLALAAPALAETSVLVVTNSDGSTNTVVVTESFGESGPSSFVITGAPIQSSIPSPAFGITTGPLFPANNDAGALCAIDANFNMCR